MHVLIIEDNPDQAANVCDFLEAKGHSADADPGYLGGRHDLLLLGQASGDGWLKRLLNQLLAPVLAPG